MFNIFSESVNSSCGIINCKSKFRKKSHLSFRNVTINSSFIEFYFRNDMVFIVIFRNNICFWQYQLYNVTYSTSTYPIINVYFRSFVFYCLTGSVYPRYTISHWCYYSNPIFPYPIFYPLQAVPEKYPLGSSDKSIDHTD